MSALGEEKTAGSEGCVRWKVDGHRGVVTLDAPERRNALGHEDWMGLGQALEALDTDDVSVVTLTGGDKWFCAGFNVRSLKPAAAGIMAAASSLPFVNRTLLRLWNYSRPVVAAVEGPAIGAGCALALAADLVVAGESAFFAPPVVQRGLVPDVGIAWLLERRLGHQRASAMVLLAERLGVQDAAALGLVNRIVPDGTTAAVAAELAEHLAATPTDTTRLAKIMLRRASESSLETVLAGEAAYVSINSMSSTAREAREGFFGPAPIRD